MTDVGPGPWIAMAALIVAITAVLLTVFGSRTRENKDYLDQLQKRLEAVEEDLERCEARCKELESERNELRSDNYDLMRRIIGMPERKP